MSLHAALSIGIAGIGAPPSAAEHRRAPPSTAEHRRDEHGAQLATWQNAPSSPTTTVTDAYDGEGNRVVQRVTSGGGSTTTTTDYVVGGLMEQVVGGGTPTSYYTVPGVVTAISVNGALSYLASDGLGSVTAALSSSSALLSASQLFGPYGATRYSSGVMPTAKGFTGQYGDGATGLDYYNARYYDPVAGQFISADSVLPGDGMDVWGLSRYAYVEGNPETGTDPSGHCWLVCAVVAAVATAVVVTAVDVAVQAVQNAGDFSKIVYGSALTKGAVAGVIVGAAIALGPLAGVAAQGLGAGAGALEAGASIGEAGLTAASTIAEGTNLGLLGSDAVIMSSSLGDAAATVGSSLVNTVGAYSGARLAGAVMGFGSGIAHGVAVGLKTGRWDWGSMLEDGVAGFAAGWVDPVWGNVTVNYAYNLAQVYGSPSPGQGNTGPLHTASTPPSDTESGDGTVYHDGHHFS